MKKEQNNTKSPYVKKTGQNGAETPLEIRIPLSAVTGTLILAAALTLLFAGIRVCAFDARDESETEFFSAQVVRTGKTDTSGSDETMINKTIPFSAVIKTGSLKGKTVKAAQDINSFLPVQAKEVQNGDRIVLAKLYDESGFPLWKFSSHSRLGGLGALAAVFLAFVIILGGKKGVRTTISLLLTAGAIFGVYIPGILKGMNVYALTCTVGTYIILMTLAVLNGPGKKTAAAITGNLLGLALAGFITALMTVVLDLTGMSDPDFVFLIAMNPQHPINLKAVLWGAAVIGSLGAVMDVAMTIASSLQELAENAKDARFSVLLRSGMNIGRDAIGTMTNTLILAYVGSSLAAILLFTAYNKSALLLLNTERLAGEIVQALAGSMGILFSVPATAIVAAYLYARKPAKHGAEK